jgi:hypothetical protein
MQLRITISPNKVAMGCIVIAVLFVIIDLVTQYPRYSPFDFPFRHRLDRVFHMGREANVPAWFSTVLFLLAALLLSIIAYAKTMQRGAFRYHWFMLSAVFVYLSADEAAVLHEELGNAVGAIFPNTILSYGWFVPGAIAVAVFAIFCLRFLLNLPGKTRWVFVLAGSIFVGGAIGIEALASPYENGRPPDFLFAILVALEEFMELAGLTIFIYALMNYIYTTMDGLTFVISSSDESRTSLLTLEKNRRPVAVVLDGDR